RRLGNRRDGNDCCYHQGSEGYLGHVKSPQRLNLRVLSDGRLLLIFEAPIIVHWYRLSPYGSIGCVPRAVAVSSWGPALARRSPNRWQMRFVEPLRAHIECSLQKREPVGKPMRESP